MEKQNNIFEFAKKELSQDAVICWMLNWINYPESELHQLGKEMFALLGENDIDIKQEITIHQQFKKADIVVVLHGSRRIIIIEDKVTSSLHDDQITKYRDALKIDQVQRELGVIGEVITDIRAVYFKTGFFYDVDNIIKYDNNIDVIVSGYDFYNLIKKYVGKSSSEILESYIAYLSEFLQWYDKYGDYTKQYETGEYFVSWEYIAQYRLMRDIFPEEMWDKESNVFMVEQDSSSGRPWAESSICPSLKYKNGDEYCFFWRIDTDNKGPYISLRFYESFNKNESEKKKRHKKYYDHFVKHIQDVVEKNVSITKLCWNDVQSGYRGSYKESALITIHLSEYLDNWGERGEELINSVRLYTEDFVSGLYKLIEEIEKES